MKTLLPLTILLLLPGIQPAWGQEDLKSKYDKPPAALEGEDNAFVTRAELSEALASTADRLTHQFRMAQEANKFWASLVLSTLALLSLVIGLYAVRSTTHSASHLVNVSGLVLVVFGTIMLVILATTGAQMTAAVGILGAVAGYLFGRIGVSRGKAPAARGSSGGSDPARRP